jgi:cytidylate kinase
MDERVRLNPYLEAMTYAKPTSAEIGARGPQPFITISRQTGAGGRTLAKKLLEAMAREHQNPLFEGWQMVDAGTCEKLLQQMKLQVPWKILVNEAYRSQMDDFVSALLFNQRPQDDVLHKLFNRLRLMALNGKVIIVGRGGVCYTRDLPLGVHLRLIAPLADRIQRIRTTLHLDEAAARGLIEQRDAARAKLMRSHFDANIDDPQLYDAVLNTGVTSTSDIVPMVLELLRHRAAALPHATVYSS